MKRLLALALCLGASLSTASAPRAQNWPTKTIRIEVGFAAGGSTDVTARVLAQALSVRLKQPVIVENRPGAGANIAADYVAKAAPDGYTLLLATSTSHAANPSLYQHLPFNVQTDFAPITQVTFIPNIMVVNRSFPASNVTEFIAYAKANPGKINFGSAGNGSSQHLAGELFNSVAGVNMVHVAYRGGAPAINDLLAGQVQVVFAPLIEALEQVRAGNLKAIGITTRKASPLLPDVPPIADKLPGYDVALWNGLFAPAKTPAAIIDRLNTAAVDALRSDELKVKFAAQGSEPVGSTPEAFRDFVAAELEKWGKLVQISGAKVQ